MPVPWAAKSFINLTEVVGIYWNRIGNRTVYYRSRDQATLGVRACTATDELTVHFTATLQTHSAMRLILYSWAELLNHPALTGSEGSVQSLYYLMGHLWSACNIVEAKAGLTECACPLQMVWQLSFKTTDLLWQRIINGTECTLLPNRKIFVSAVNLQEPLCTKYKRR